MKARRSASSVRRIQLGPRCAAALKRFARRARRYLAAPASRSRNSCRRAACGRWWLVPPTVPLLRHRWQTPTTKILAVGTFVPGTDMSQVQRILPTEARETAQLYLDGKIDQWYSLEDRPGVVFMLNMTDTQAAHAVLEELPLGKAHLMTFQLTPIGPLNPLRQLLVLAVPH